MSSGSSAPESSRLLPLLSLLPVPPEPPPSEPASAETTTYVWCPRSPPEDEQHATYWRTVNALSAAHETGVIPRASDLLTAAFAETRSVFSDDGPLKTAAAYFSDLGDACEFTVRALPDLCAAVIYVPFWGSVPSHVPEALREWATLMGQVLPNPCRARAFVPALIRRLDQPIFYDYVLRVIFAALLGIYDRDKEVRGVRERMVLYAAFSLNPPTPWQLARFVELAPQFTLFACRQHLFFTIQQVPAVHSFLCETYHWREMEKAVADGLDAARKHMLIMGLLPGFLSNEQLWTRCETLLFAQNQLSLCYCYRAAAKPFHEKLLADYERLTRADERYRPGPSAVQLVDAFSYASDFHTDGLLSFDIADPRHWPDVLPTRFLDKLCDVKAAYDSETQMTSAGTLLQTIHREAPFAYNGLFCVLEAISHRLSLRWQRLPQQWAQRQLEAVSKLGGDEDAGVYLVCSKCRELRATPLVYPQGFDERARASARFPEKVSIRMNGFAPVRLVCHARGIRKHDATAKRHEHNYRKQPSTRAKKIDPIAVCSDIEVLRINLVGVLLYTEVNGLVTLCVDCGTLLKWTRKCLTDRGPTCGCQLDSIATLVNCDICKKRQPMDKLRKHQVLRKTGLSEVAVCIAHNTQWLDMVKVVPIFSEVRDAVLRRKARIPVGDSFVFVNRRKRRGRR